VTKVQTATTTSPPGGGAPAAKLRATTYTFEAREPLDVQGRRYDTCRYRETPLAGGPVTVNWVIVGSGITAGAQRGPPARRHGAAAPRAAVRCGQRHRAGAGTGHARRASADRMVAEFGYVLPICSAGGAARARRPDAGHEGAAPAGHPPHAACGRAGGRARPPGARLHLDAARDQLGDCGGRITYPSYQHVNGVTTATMRMDSYCSKDSDTGGTQVVDGSWSFVETAQPGATRPIRVRYEASSPAGLTVVDKDASGKVHRHAAHGRRRLRQHASACRAATPRPNVPTASRWRMAGAQRADRQGLPADRLQRDDLPDAGRRRADHDQRPRLPLDRLLRPGDDVADRHQRRRRRAVRVLTSAGADGQAVVMTLVPGADFQATMTVDGKPVTTAPACQ
jgi:hypothetical protein